MSNSNKVILITGSNRSGKSIWAEHLADRGMPIIYISTMLPEYIKDDKLLTERVNKHKLRRPKNWILVESLGLLADDLIAQPSNSDILIDSIGGYVSANLSLSETVWSNSEESFLANLKSHNGKVIVVSEEVGWGVVPMTPEGNLFRDRLGYLNNQLESISHESWLIIHGRALDLKALGVPL